MALIEEIESKSKYFQELELDDRILKSESNIQIARRVTIMSPFTIMGIWGIVENKNQNEDKTQIAMKELLAKADRCYNTLFYNAITKLGWMEPTLIQEKAIPLLLEGKDLLIKARTGSGKTAAFTIPLIQKILLNKRIQKKQEIKSLIIASSKELCKQIHDVILSLTIKCCREVRAIDLSLKTDLNAQKLLLSEMPDIVVVTPNRLLQHLKAKNLVLKRSLDTLIIDEADLLFSFGYEKDLKAILTYLPMAYQAILASATLSEDVQTLKKLILHNPAILKLEEPPLAPPTQLTHYTLAAEENDKAAILYALLKLHLIRCFLAMEHCMTQSYTMSTCN